LREREGKVEVEMMQCENQGRKGRDVEEDKSERDKK